MEHAVTRIITTGAEGYDGHPDHIAAHIAALGAALDTAHKGQYAELWALHADHAGVITVQGDTNRKLEAMACHASQRVHPDLRCWGDSSRYTPLIIGPETYDVISMTELTDMIQTMALDQAA